MGTSGKKIGNAHLKWAFSEAAVLFLRRNTQAVKYPEGFRGKAKSLTILSHKPARAVYYILKRKEVFQPEVFFAK